MKPLQSTLQEQLRYQMNENKKGKFKISALSYMRGEYLKTTDDIHGSIKYCPVIKLLIDSPYMQRLRELKQLGVTHYVYVNAVHTRFEHSLGVAHLAKKMVKKIRKKQPKLGITDKDILCVQIAGLCHDWGHGPFSHVFDGPFQNEIQKYNPDYVKVPHEEVSLTLIDAALKSMGLEIDPNNLDAPLKQIGDGIAADKFGVCDDQYDMQQPLPLEKVFTSRDWIFVKECILAEPLKKNSKTFVGRKKEKEFLYDIVSNRHNGLDVDKIDYFARDAKRALGNEGKPDMKFIYEAFVAKANCPRPDKCFHCKKRLATQHYMICYPEKLVTKSMDFFKTRFRLHSTVYTHKTSQAELLLTHILSKADPYFKVLNGSSEPVKMSEANKHPEAFLNLTDSILSAIKNNNSNENYEEVHALIDRLQKRDLYKCAASLPIEPQYEKLWDLNETDIKHKLVTMSKGKLDIEDMIVVKRTIHHGMKEKNPVNFMRFLSKHQQCELDAKVNDLPMAVLIPESTYISHIPRELQARKLSIYCKTNDDDNKSAVVSHFLQFVEYTKKNLDVESLAYSSPKEKINAPMPLTQDSNDEYDIDEKDDEYYEEKKINGDHLGVLKRNKRNRENDSWNDADTNISSKAKKALFSKMGVDK